MIRISEIKGLFLDDIDHEYKYIL